MEIGVHAGVRAPWEGAWGPDGNLLAMAVIGFASGAGAGDGMGWVVQVEVWAGTGMGMRVGVGGLLRVGIPILSPSLLSLSPLPFSSLLSAVTSSFWGDPL